MGRSMPMSTLPAPCWQTSIEQIAPPSYGPDIQFVYTFPQPGTYQLWAQFQHGEKIVTVPFTLEVGE
jgi:hypothetical protein